MSKFKTVAHVVFVQRPKPHRLLPYLRYQLLRDASAAPLVAWADSQQEYERVAAMAELAEQCDAQSLVFLGAFGSSQRAREEAEDLRRCGVVFRLLALADGRALLRFGADTVVWLDDELLDEHLADMQWLREDDASLLELVRPYLFDIAALHYRARFEVEGTNELAGLLEKLGADLTAFACGRPQLPGDIAMLASMLREWVAPRLAWPAAA